MKKVIALLAIVLSCSVTTAMAQGPGGQMTPEERAARTKERVKAIGGLTDVQVDSAVAVFLDQSYNAAAGMTRDTPPEEREAKMKVIADLRTKRLVKAGFSADLAKKVIEAMAFRRPG